MKGANCLNYDCLKILLPTNNSWNEINEFTVINQTHDQTESTVFITTVQNFKNNILVLLQSFYYCNRFFKAATV